MLKMAAEKINHINKILESLRCSVCKKYTKYACEASGNIYCKPCVIKMAPYQPLRFRSVRPYHHVSNIVRTFVPLLEEEDEEEAAVPPQPEVTGQIQKKASSASIAKMYQLTLQLKKVKEKAEERRLPEMTELQRFFNKLTIYYEKDVGMVDTLIRCFQAGAEVFELKKRSLLERNSGHISSYTGRLEVIAKTKNFKGLALSGNKNIFKECSIPTIDIEYFKLLLDTKELIILDFFLLVPETTKELVGLSFPFFTVHNDFNFFK